MIASPLLFKCTTRSGIQTGVGGSASYTVTFIVSVPDIPQSSRIVYITTYFPVGKRIRPPLEVNVLKILLVSNVKFAEQFPEKVAGESKIAVSQVPVFIIWTVRSAGAFTDIAQKEVVVA